MAQNTNSGVGRIVVTVIVALATFLLMAFLVRQMVRYTAPAPLGADRGAARAKDNTQIRAEGAQTLSSYGYVEQPKGIVRVPIDEAMKLTVEGYKNAAQFRSNLLSRLDKATAAAPKPPEKPNEYE